MTLQDDDPKHRSKATTEQSETRTQPTGDGPQENLRPYLKGSMKLICAVGRKYVSTLKHPIIIVKMMLMTLIDLK